MFNRIPRISRLCQGLVATALLAVTSTSQSAAVSNASNSWNGDFSRLIDLTATRLHVAREVALTKWDTRKPIEDSEREGVVISAAATQAEPAGVPRQLATHFFADQIEANKLVQYGLLARWHRAGKAPSDHRASLTDDIRPELDRLQGEFIRELAATDALRAAPDCYARLARATQSYSSAHKLDALYSVALDRALARVCEK
ncbi:chorismate mutase [Caballeronia sordidicola]|uniref:Chorismate mutase n=1 Tax=Caballeronia sordidicola TaxID=196367 RepID=A0A158FJR2_CABSO|nr:chorismate mutase [Caballeronia sordidicola]SAL19975.1 chorismate mutase [Caballeronia sordidicola]